MEADEEFVVVEEGTEEDDEQTLEEEEKMEEDLDHKDEIDNLQKEGKTGIQIHNSAKNFRLQKVDSFSVFLASFFRLILEYGLPVPSLFHVQC